MKNTLLVVAAIAVMSAGLLSAQSAAPIVKRDPGYTVPRTPWGDPDLQGTWPSTEMVGTPMQRDTKLGTRNVLTEAEYKKVQERFARQAAQDEADFDLDHAAVTPGGDVGGPVSPPPHWLERGKPQYQASLIVDPPDGRIPPLTPEARKRLAAAAAAEKVKGIDVTSPGVYTRCITGNGGPPRIPGGVTAESQILQTPGYVVMVHQSNNDVRIIPLDGRPHLPTTVSQWLGDARGHWEGTTLVVETTNFNAERNWRGSTDAMHLVERFTLVGPKTLRYQFTVTDPTTWTQPWSIDSFLPRIDPPLYEFACHEQNYGLINWAIGSQIREREAAAGGQSAQPSREER